MRFVAADPGLNSLSVVVDFFDNKKCGVTVTKVGTTPRGTLTRKGTKKDK